MICLSPAEKELNMVQVSEIGIVRIPSAHSVAETVSKLETMLQAKGAKLFVTKLLIFGNPNGGTPLMLAEPSVALDLPLKILVAEDADGKAWISYNATSYLQARHQLPAELLPNIAVIDTIAENLAK
jgi:uncharacterized protein (DUF302 family)